MQRHLHNDPVITLRDNPTWEALNNESAHLLLSNSVRIDSEKGDDVPSDLGIVVSGILGVRRDYADGRYLYCTLFHGGDVFDLRREERQRQGCLLAVTKASVLCLNEAALSASLRVDPALVEFMIGQLREQFARLRDHCADLTFKTPLERMASTILEFRRWPEAKANGSAVIHLPITRAEIAVYVGLKPETVSRALKQMARSGIIRKSGRSSLEIVDLPALRMLANGGHPRGSRMVMRSCDDDPADATWS
ncbi:MAG: Crp/Fnr family transcriptional regulator [Pseudomonadota bacterium]